MVHGRKWWCVSLSTFFIYDDDDNLDASRLFSSCPSDGGTRTLATLFNKPEGSEPMVSVKPQILQEHLEKEERESNEKAEKYRECEVACHRFIQFWSCSSEKNLSE